MKNKRRDTVARDASLENVRKRQAKLLTTMDLLEAEIRLIRDTPDDSVVDLATRLGLLEAEYKLLRGKSEQ